jgi:hypothetical protein
MAVTVLSGPERRRRWFSTEKRQIVHESLAPAASVAAVARRRDILPICFISGGGRPARELWGMGSRRWMLLAVACGLLRSRLRRNESR